MTKRDTSKVGSGYCPQCGHDDSVLLGKLGMLLYVRCRACGWDYAVDVYDDDDAEDSFAE